MIRGSHSRTPSNARRRTSSLNHSRTPSSSQQINPLHNRTPSSSQHIASQQPTPHSHALDPSAVPFHTGPHTGRMATAAELRLMEERLTRLEELSQSVSVGVSSQDPGFSVSDRQRDEVARLGRNASGGPSAPPQANEHSDLKLLRTFRRLVYMGYGGAKGGQDITVQPYPGRGAWPKHPPSPLDDDAELDQARSAEDELTSGNQIRLHYGRPYTDAINQGQLRKTFRYMLSHRKRCGVPADMSSEELVARCRSTFKGWVREYTRSLSAAGRKKKRLALSRSCLAARRKRKAGSRAKASRMDRYYFLSDGSKVAKSGDPDELGRVRRGAVRADIEFAVQAPVMSDEEDEWETIETEHDVDNWSDDVIMSDGGRPGREVRRRLGIPWRSKSLISRLELLDKKRKRQPSKPILPPNRLCDLPPNFTLPSNIRRWMVAESWAEANEDACVDVSDNAGPFQGPYSVSKGAKEWGPDPDWSIYNGHNGNTSSDEGDDEERVEAAGPSSAPASRRRRREDDDEADDDDDSDEYEDMGNIGRILDSEAGWGAGEDENDDGWEDEVEGADDDS
ncbi:hypothetical protein CF319_g7530 [Tilletia indica]|nr:hypothetical protein CF319_g7530 [Tilletia indica]